MTTDSIPQRTCKSCNQSYPLTAEHWHKDKTAAHGFTYSCKECAKARARKWGQDNNEYTKEQHRRYYAENKAQFQAYRAANADYIANWKRQWRKDNPEMVKRHKSASQKRNRAAATERNKRYNEKYPEKRRATTLNRIARKQNAEGKYTAADIAVIYEDQMGRCLYCGITLHDDYHVDHIIPLAKQGTNWPDNLAVACPYCNVSKNDNLLDEWIAVRGW